MLFQRGHESGRAISHGLREYLYTLLQETLSSGLTQTPLMPKG